MTKQCEFCGKKIKAKFRLCYNCNKKNKQLAKDFYRTYKKSGFYNKNLNDQLIKRLKKY